MSNGTLSTLSLLLLKLPQLCASQKVAAAAKMLASPVGSGSIPAVFRAEGSGLGLAEVEFNMRRMPKEKITQMSGELQQTSVLHRSMLCSVW